MEMLGNGVYSFAEAARLTGLHSARVRAWFSRERKGGRTAFSSDYGQVAGQPAISFLDLIDVRVAGELRREGVSLQSIRKFYDLVRTKVGVGHAFAHQRFLTDGRRLFMAARDELGREHIIDLLKHQYVFTSVIKPFLRQVDYDPTTSLARVWHIAPGIVIDPQRNFGAPTVERIGVSTSVLASAVTANRDDVALIARWYEVPESVVQAAVAFEGRTAA